MAKLKTDFVQSRYSQNKCLGWLSATITPNFRSKYLNLTELQLFLCFVLFVGCSINLISSWLQKLIHVHPLFIFCKCHYNLSSGAWEILPTDTHTLKNIVGFFTGWEYHVRCCSKLYSCSRVFMIKVIQCSYKSDWESSTRKSPIMVKLYNVSLLLDWCSRSPQR